MRSPAELPNMIPFSVPHATALSASLSSAGFSSSGVSSVSIPR